MKFVKPLAIALSLAAVLSAGSAFAATMAVTKQTNSYFGTQNWQVIAKYSGYGSAVYAGAFQLKASAVTGTRTFGDAAGNFMAFCLSPFTAINLKTYEVVTSANLQPLTALSTAMVTKLSALANGAWAKIVDANTAAAFQLAAWEIVAETKEKVLNISSGSFVVSQPSASSTAFTTAQSWLDAVNDNTFRSSPTGITLLAADGTQDLLTYTPPAPVPLPGAFGFLAVGLAALAAKGRARRI